MTVGDVEMLRETERQRLRALVAADMAVAEPMHADDFQLINPQGGVLTKEQYLGAVAAGVVDYLSWEPEEIEVRLHSSATIIRYRAQTEAIIAGEHVPPRWQWHTDFYEQRDGRWQVVWSQATAITSEW